MSGIRWWLQRDPALLMPARRLGLRRHRARRPTAARGSAGPRATPTNASPRQGDAGGPPYGLGHPDATHVWLTFSGTAALFSEIGRAHV